MFGSGLCTGVNARVSAVSEWIDATVCNISDHAPPEFCRKKESFTTINRNRMGWKLTWPDAVFFLVLALFAAKLINAFVKQPFNYEKQHLRHYTSSSDNSYDSISNVEIP